jgi:RNA polymerase sigma-70 factor, ECF subfamily
VATSALCRYHRAEGFGVRNSSAPRRASAPALHSTGANPRLLNALSITVQTHTLTETLQHFTDERQRYIKGLPSPSISGSIQRSQAVRVRKFQKEDLVTHFAQLLEPEIPRLRRYARALTRDASRADDLVQSCLVRAISKQHLWQEGTDLRAWLFTTLHNQHVNEVRRAAREGAPIPVDEVASAMPAEENALDSLQLRDLDRAMGSLADEHRQVILLVGLEGRSYEEVAEILGIPNETVCSRLSRGRETLRVLMGMREDTARAPARAQPASSEREAA